MNEDIRWASRSAQSLYNAEHWYPYYFRSQFCEYGQDSRRLFSTPGHLREIIEVLPVLMPQRGRISESQKLALDTAVIFGQSVLHDAEKSAEKLFEVCHNRGSFQHGFFMVPFPVESLITAAEIIRASQYVKQSDHNQTVVNIYTDAGRYFLSREYEFFLEKLNLNLIERVLVKKPKCPVSTQHLLNKTEFNNTMRFMSDLVEEGVYRTDYGKKYLEKTAIQNILKLLETGTFDEKTSTIK